MVLGMPAVSQLSTAEEHHISWSLVAGRDTPPRLSFVGAEEGSGLKLGLRVWMSSDYYITDSRCTKRKTAQAYVS